MIKWSLFCGQVCLTVFRYLCGLPFGPIWDFNIEPMKESFPTDVFIGVVLGLIGAAIAAIFANFHWKLMEIFKALDLMDNNKAVQRALLGSIGVILIGMLIPHTMFWGKSYCKIIAIILFSGKKDQTLTKHTCFLHSTIRS